MSDSLKQELHAKIEMLTPSMKARVNGYVDGLIENDEAFLPQTPEEIAEVNRLLDQSEREYREGKTLDAAEVIAKLKRRSS